MMSDTKTKTHGLEKIQVERLYSSSVLRLARHLWRVHESAHVLEIADELQKRPGIVVVGVVDEAGRSIGIVRRDRLFALIGKPFGREVLQRSAIKEVAESAMTFHAHADLFAVAQELRQSSWAQGNEDRDAEVEGKVGEMESGTEYFPLVDDVGRLRGILAGQDLANHLARITQDDIEIAGQLQERLLAGAEFPSDRGYRLQAWSRSAKGVGGDFYFAREIGGGKIFAALCDVSGKGVAASLIVSMVWGLLRGYDFRRGLRELLASLNRAVVATFQLEKYLTGFFMIYDPESKKLVYADMGHSHVMLIREGRAHTVRSSRLNLPIGIEPEIEPALNSIRLREEDRLFTFSDGITEQENPEGIEFGERRLVRHLLAQTRNRKGESLADTLPASIDAYREGTPQQDDMSFMLIDIDGASVSGIQD